MVEEFDDDRPDEEAELPPAEVYEDENGDLVHHRSFGPYHLTVVDGNLMVEMPEGYQSKDDLEAEVERLRARLDASTRSALRVEPLDIDPKYAMRISDPS